MQPGGSQVAVSHSISLTTAIVGSDGVSLPSLMMPSSESTINIDECFEHTPLAKPKSSATSRRKMGTRKQRWKNSSTRAKLNFATGDFTKFKNNSQKDFEALTVGELRESFEKLKGREADCGLPVVDAPAYVNVPDASWLNEHLDGEINLFDEDAADKPAEILGFSWRSEPEIYQDNKWVKVNSVVDSGASTGVAPPGMVPNVKVVPSEGSNRKQMFTSASKHKLKNVGEQRILACTEAGEPMDVLFQIADVSKPLVSVSAICERGNRVIFGRSGGVVQNLKSGS